MAITVLGKPMHIYETYDIKHREAPHGLLKKKETKYSANTVRDGNQRGTESLNQEKVARYKTCVGQAVI